MSKGLGKVEVSVLDVLEADSADVLDSISLTIKIHGRDATSSQYSSTRRALSSLTNKGLISRLTGRFRFGRTHYGLPARVDKYLARENAFRSRLRL